MRMCSSSGHQCRYICCMHGTYIYICIQLCNGVIYFTELEMLTISCRQRALISNSESNVKVAPTCTKRCVKLCKAM